MKGSSIPGPNGKNPPKIRFEKFVKWMDHTYNYYSLNSLTMFEFAALAMTRNGNTVNLSKFAWKICEITTYFWWILGFWNHCAA